jgi:hypothetical protein
MSYIIQTVMVTPVAIPSGNIMNVICAVLFVATDVAAAGIRGNGIGASFC